MQTKKNVLEAVDVRKSDRMGRITVDVLKGR